MTDTKPKRTKATSSQANASLGASNQVRRTQKVKSATVIRKQKPRILATSLIGTFSEEKECLFCQSPKKEGILLKDDSFLCVSCYKKISAIKYTDFSLKEKQKVKQQQINWNKRKAHFFKSCEPVIEKGSTSKIYIVDVILIAATGLALTQQSMAIASFSVLIAIFWYTINSMRESQEKLRVIETNRKRLEESEKEKQNWLIQNPEPPRVLLEKHLNTSLDRLTTKDQLVVRILKNLPDVTTLQNSDLKDAEE